MKNFLVILFVMIAVGGNHVGGASVVGGPHKIGGGNYISTFQVMTVGGGQ